MPGGLVMKLLLWRCIVCKFRPISGHKVSVFFLQLLLLCVNSYQCGCLCYGVGTIASILVAVAGLELDWIYNHNNDILYTVAASTVTFGKTILVKTDLLKILM